ncbi:hypothetical protein BDV95DRAFT_565348 [Massariosphaeria phaeospora]|uniref:Uncharacterized protein n=1 Tax=Massariosphaeria phaeospora TaxID=100035 RepID=A0A7C8IE82_9PLEO|nr:hypothetical protein BDV95DRAFT_565348 [Massariosphaeria phaeospora]
MISESDNVSVPGLEVLHLENVRLGKDTVKFLLSLAVDLTMKNILWPRRASSPSGVKPMLKSAKVSGAMVDVADHSPFSNTGIFWFVGTQHQSQQFNDFYKDRIKPASPDANPIPYVSPDVMERWILRGGDLPFRYENRWGRLGLFFRPRDVPNYASYTDRDNDSQ